MKYLRRFSSHTDYEEYINSSGRCFPNISYCEDVEDVHYKTQLFGDVLTARFDITSVTESTRILGNIDVMCNISAIEVDGIVIDSVVDNYLFDSIGEHTVRYGLIDKTVIGVGCFYGCDRLVSVDVPDGVKKIGLNEYGNGNSFRNCVNLSSVTLPDSLEMIHYHSFDGCSSLTGISIPSGVTYIGEDVLTRYMVSVYVNPIVPPSLGRFSSSRDPVYYVPAGSLELYKTTGNWAMLGDKIRPMD